MSSNRIGTAREASQNEQETISPPPLEFGLDGLEGQQKNHHQKEGAVVPLHTEYGQKYALDAEKM